MIVSMFVALTIFWSESGHVELEKQAFVMRGCEKSKLSVGVGVLFILGLLIAWDEFV